MVSEKGKWNNGNKRKNFPEKSNPRVREEGHHCLFGSCSDQWPVYDVPRFYGRLSLSPSVSLSLYNPSLSTFTARGPHVAVPTPKHKQIAKLIISQKKKKFLLYLRGHIHGDHVLGFFCSISRPCKDLRTPWEALTILWFLIRAYAANSSFGTK